MREIATDGRYRTMWMEFDYQTSGKYEPVISNLKEHKLSLIYWKLKIRLFAVLGLEMAIPIERLS